MTFGHDPFRWTPLVLKAEEDPPQSGKVAKVFQAMANPLRKSFMPSTWKWMRTSGLPKVFTYTNNTGESTTVSFKLPAWMRPYLRGTTGVYPTSPTGSTIVKMVAGDTLTMGGRQSVTMTDAEGGTAVTTFPTLSFTQDGISYKLDWESFAQERKISEGSNGQDWGYPSQGQPTYGVASMYDATLPLSWNRVLSPFWWLLLIGAAGSALYALFRRKKHQD